MCSKTFYRTILFFYGLIVRRLKFIHTTNLKLQKCPSLITLGSSGTGQNLVFQLEGGLLRSTSTFPYFMLVALEAGSFLRGLLLLLLYPLICILSHEMGLSIMTMVAFCGVRVDGFRLGRAVLPKHFLEDVALEAFEVLERFQTRICFTGIPRVMAEGFLREYLGVEKVVGREIKVLGAYFTGVLEGEGKVVAKVKRELESVANDDGSSKKSFLGVGGLEIYSFHEIFSNCNEVYLASKTDKIKWQTLPRSRYPKPLIFHDGRIALKPTPLNSLSLFLWLPLSVPLGITRAAIFILLPYSISVPLVALLGMPARLMGRSHMNTYAHTEINVNNHSEQREHQVMNKSRSTKGQIYVCNHRTLLDPLYIAGAIGRNVTATTYSVSRLSEILSPIRTIRLTRNKEVDKQKMEALLDEGDIVVCPEGTTCREPYLLRFSPLFAELNRVVIPVALITNVGMFYGTTASGRKFLDPLYFVMNPWPRYVMEFLDEVDASTGDNLGRQWNNHYDVANHVQRKIGKALGFECTILRRRDKYLMLADNEGIVQAGSRR